MAKDDNSVIFLKDWKLLIQSLSAENQLYFWELFTDYEYQSDKECNNDYVKPIWNFVKSQLDNMKEKYINKTVKTNQQNGKLGGRPKKTETNQNNPMGFSETQITPKDKDNNKDNIKDNYNNFLLSEIKNFKSFYSCFLFNKQYLLIAYKFWEMWLEENPSNKTIKTAKLVNWYETIRLIIEVDKQKIERLIAIYKFFQKCQAKESGYRDFWFKTVKSVGGLRDTNKNGEYRLDKIADEVNDKIDKDEMFGRLVEKAIEDFKKY